jgi:two-component system, NtrC family, response regulator AtoC
MTRTDDETATSARSFMVSGVYPVSGGFRQSLTVVHSPNGDTAEAAPLRDVLRIGSGQDADLRLSDPSVSRHHARLERAGPGETWRIVDRSSKSGVFVNGQRVRTSALQAGDVIRLGDSLLVLDDPDRFGKVAALGYSLADSGLPLRIEGETGVGKERLAREIHRASGSQGPFVAVNCARLGEGIGEAELFGHARGAFTGADRERTGLITSAHNGSLFLDELDELPLSLQADLLRVVESGCVRPIGSTRTVPVDVRFLAASSTDLDDLEAKGAFRRNLLARFGEALRIPPPRQRRVELVALVRQLSTEIGLSALPSVDALELMLQLPWPRNVRELKRLLMTIQALVPGPTFDASVVAEHAAGARTVLARIAQGASPVEAGSDGENWSGALTAPRPEHVDSMSASTDDEGEALGSIDRNRLLEALRRTGGNVRRAANWLGRSRRHFYRLLERHGIDSAELRATRKRNR